MVKLSTDFEGAVCEIKTVDNVLLTLGLISKITDEYVEISTYKGEDLALLRLDMTVKISMNYMGKFEVAMGTVYISSETKLKLVDVQNLQDFERRSFFRVPANNIPTTMLPIAEDGISANFEEEPIRVIIDNLSLSGMLMFPENNELKFKIGDKFVIDIPIGKNTISINIQVCRLENPDKENPKFGCKYFNMNDKTSDILYTYIFQLEREFLKNRKKGF